jgi:hypothetical protein
LLTASDRRPTWHSFRTPTPRLDYRGVSFFPSVLLRDPPVGRRAVLACRSFRSGNLSSPFLSGNHAKAKAPNAAPTVFINRSMTWESRDGIHAWINSIEKLSTAAKRTVTKLALRLDPTQDFARYAVKKNPLSPGMLRDPRIHAARSRRLSAVARWTLRSKYA